MAIRYNGIEFDSVQELVEYQKAVERKPDEKRLQSPKEEKISQDEKLFGVPTDNFRHKVTKSEVLAVKALYDKVHSENRRIHNDEIMELAKQLGRTYASIQNIAHKHNFSRRSLKKQINRSTQTNYPALAILFREQYDKGLVGSINEFCEKQNLSKGSVSVRLGKEYKKLIGISPNKRLRYDKVPEVKVEKKKRVMHFKPEHLERMRKRMLVVNERAKQLVAQFQYSWDKAREVAISEYDSKYKGVQVEQEKKKEYVPVEFPEVFPITKDSKDMLISITKSIIANKGKVRYYDVLYSLETEKGEWNGILFHEFVADFMRKTKQISEYFNVPNKFVWTREGNFDIIEYKG